MLWLFLQFTLVALSTGVLIGVTVVEDRFF
jgi:hypothetical protein